MIVSASFTRLYASVSYASVIRYYSYIVIYIITANKYCVKWILPIPNVSVMLFAGSFFSGVGE